MAKNPEQIKIRTDNKWKNFLYGYELSTKWRKEFDWNGIKSETFFRGF